MPAVGAVPAPAPDLARPMPMPVVNPVSSQDADAASSPSQLEVAALRAELVELRGIVAALRRAPSPQSTVVLEPNSAADVLEPSSTAPLDQVHADPFNLMPLRTVPNAKGEMPPAAVCHLSSSMFPHGKKSKSEYHPPQVHNLAAHRLFKVLGYPPSEGKYSSSTAFVLAFVEMPCMKFQKSIATAVATYSCRLGSRGASIAMFKETTDVVELSPIGPFMHPKTGSDGGIPGRMDSEPIGLILCTGTDPSVPSTDLNIGRCTKTRTPWAVSVSRVAVSATQYTTSAATLERQLNAQTEATQARLQARLRDLGLSLPSGASSDPNVLNKPLQGTMSEFVRRTRMPLPQLVELVRGQTKADYRPNKALIAQEGVRVPLSRTMSRSNRPLENHPSARERLNVLRKNVRREQDAGRVIVVDMDLLALWREVIVSPYGVVDKAGSDPQTTGRTIQNLSYPPGYSVNEATNKSAMPTPDYLPIESIAQEIVRLRELYPNATIFLLAGDVALAFRHVHLHSSSVHLFGGVIPEDNALIIDMACPFGWTGCPGFYELFGSAISFVHGRTSEFNDGRPFFSYHWVDDHVLIAVGPQSHRDACERSLRTAMISILGPRAINESKFSGWHPRLKVLGLLFDTDAMTVAMPDAKVDKAKSKVVASYYATSLSTAEYRSLLGSLRHVATCIRSARPFLQRLRKAEFGLQFRKNVQVTAAMRLDLLWWWNILHSPRLNGVPLDFFRHLPEPQVTVYMDACDEGLCAIEPSKREYILYQFTADEAALVAEFKEGSNNGFDINYRELLSSAFAVWAWGTGWKSSDRHISHVHFKIDNKSAVSWHQRMFSPNERAHTLIRLLAHWEDHFGLRLSASHIAGESNVLADAGSRSFSSETHRSLFNSHTAGWNRVDPPPSTSFFHETWHSITASTPLPIPPLPNTHDTSSYGASGHPSAT